MKCRDYEAQVQDFLDGKLNDVQAKEFILHVQQCGRCYEELEIYFSIYRGIGRSEDKMIEDTDFEFDGTKEDLNAMLEQVLREIDSRKFNRKIKIAVILFIAVIVIISVIALVVEIL